MILLINILINTLIIKHNFPSIKESVIITGDSHVMTALIPQEFNNAINISQTGEPYIASYFKLKKIFTFHEPKVVIIGFAPNNISAFNDRKFHDKEWSMEMFNRYYPIIQYKDYLSHEISIKDYCMSLIKNMGLYVKLKPFPYVGKFRKINKSSIGKSSAQSRIERHYYYNDKNVGISQLAINYLDSIVDITNEHQVKLVLVNTPLHRQYRAEIPQNFIDIYEKLKSEYINKNIVVIDLGNLELEDKYFADYDHLNYLGAKHLSDLISDQVNQLQSSPTSGL